MITADAEVVVVGGGVMGSATAWALARAGRAPLLLERFGPGHDRGASHGQCRNFNVMYHEPWYVDLLVESRRLWDELSDAAGRRLLELVGMVKHGEFQDGPSVAAALHGAGLRAEFLAPEAAQGRWPGMLFDGPVLHSPDSGRVRADDAVLALQEQVRRLGGEVRHHHAVTSLDAGEGGVRLRVGTPEGRLDVTARVVVVTTGAWTDRVVGGAAPLPATVVTQVQPAPFAVGVVAAGWPSFMQVSPTVRRSRLAGQESYGLFEEGLGLKVGWHGRGLTADPDARTDDYDERELHDLMDYVARWFPAADPASAQLISCTYTSTPSERFVLDRVGSVVVGTGFSGQGFKFAPAVGTALAALALGTGVPDRAFAMAAHP